MAKKTVKKTAKKTTAKTAKKKATTAAPKKAAKPATSAKAAQAAAAKKSDPARNFKKLSNVEHVRMRTGMWLGQNSLATLEQHFFRQDKDNKFFVEHDELQVVPAVWKCLDEACMNAIDEYRRNQNDKKLGPREKMNRLTVILEKDNRTISIEDNGRGIPAANAEGVFLHLMYGENFDDIARRDHVAGQNGVGISLVRMVSDYFFVKTVNRGEAYQKLFTPDEAFHKALAALKLSKNEAEQVMLYFDEHGNLDECPVLNPSTLGKLNTVMKKNMMSEKVSAAPAGKHGTFIQFRLNQAYFTGQDTSFDIKLLHQYLQDLAMTNPGLTVVFRHSGNKEEKLQFKKGLEEIFTNSDMDFYKLSYAEPKSDSQIQLDAYVVMGTNRNLTWVNSNFASLGGSPIEYLENRLCDELRKKPAIQSLEKKLKTASTRNDVRSCFHMYIDLRLLHPRFKSQDKSYLINDLNAPIRNAIDKNLDKLIRKTGIIDEIKKQMERRANLRALEAAEKGLRQAKREHIPKLIPPTGKGERVLFIAEGDSAIAGLRPARNPQVHGLFPLKGKPLNVNGMSLAKAMANEEIKNIVAILGLPINGEKVESIDQLKYDKVSIITDADFDGYAIRSLMLSFFFEYWPELFQIGFINITTAPLYEVDIKLPASGKESKETRFCLDDEEYSRLEKELQKKKGTMVRKKRNKGLGESSIAALKYAVNECMIEVHVDKIKNAEKVQTLWFDKKMAELRRNAISEYAGTIYDDN